MDVPDISPDGRIARRDRNRNAVLDAVIELFSEDHLDPGPGDVALRVGLSERSVYRYFEDREALLRAAMARHIERVMPLYVIHEIGRGPLDARIERFVTSRLRLYEAIESTARAARARAAVNEIFREQVNETHTLLQRQVDKHFAPELDAFGEPRRTARAVAIDTMCQLEALDHQRIHRELTVEQVHAVLVDALHALLHP